MAMTNYIPREQLEPFIWKPGDSKPPVMEEKPLPRTDLSEAAYALMEKTATYALGVQALREISARGECPDQPFFTAADGSSLLRPLTFRENLQARLEDFNTLRDAAGNERTENERLRFFSRWLDSCTGIAYKAGTSLMKIVPVCEPLISIGKSFNQAYLVVDYASLIGEELDRTAASYGQPLTAAQVVAHPAWLAAIEHDEALLREYSALVFSLLKEKYKKETGMRFWVRDTTQEDELRALFVSLLDVNSDASGDFDLYFGGSFLRVAPSSVPPKAGALKK